MRYLRYFNLLYIGGFDTTSVSNILNVFAEWVMIKINASEDIQNLKQFLVNNSLALYKKV
jgi:dynein heavy chain